MFIAVKAAFSFLCLRRGVSDIRCGKVVVTLFSLPTQRCFLDVFRVHPEGRLFSAYAEVFPLCPSRQIIHHVFSLPTQRCFPEFSHPQQEARLFSAYAEVFPLRRWGFMGRRAFLCLRRGVSQPAQLCLRRLVFSLPTQRCFPNPELPRSFAQLFSAYAEVFPS